MHIPIQEASKTPDKTRKEILHDIPKLKTLKTQNKVKVWQDTREKYQITYNSRTMIINQIT